MITCMFSFIFSCTSVEHIPKLNRTLDQNNYRINKAKYDIEDNYLLYHAQYATINRQSKGSNTSKISQLSSEFERMTELKKNFMERSLRLHGATIEQRQNWKGKVNITSDDPEWEALDKFKDYSSNEFEELVSIQNQYRKTETTFNKILQSNGLKPFTKKLPRTIHQARIVLKDIEQQEAYEKYNLELLENLENRAKLTAKDFESLAKFAAFDKHAQSRISKYGRFPRGKTGPSIEVEQKATKMIFASINPIIIPAAKDFASKQNSARDITINLSSIKRGQFSHLTKYTSLENIRVIDKIFNEKKSVILQGIIHKDSKQSEQIITSHKTAEDKLQRLVLLRNEFGEKYSELLNEPEVKKHLSHLQQQREKLLVTIEPRIIASIKTTHSLANLKDPLSGLLAQDDQQSGVVKRIKQVQSKKLNSLIAFKPVRRASQLKVGSFTSQGLNYETELMAIYLGDFENTRLDRNGMAISSLFKGYLDAYGKFCHQYLPTNKVPITVSKCATERVTKNGWGTITNTSCVKWVNVPTGLYADPKLYNSSNQISRNAGMKVFGNVFSGDPFASRAIVDDVLSVGNDMNTLVQKNKCNNAGLKRFETNLYYFVEGKAPLTLPGKETLNLIRNVYQVDLDSANLNLKILLDDLISENAKGWMMNRYSSGSVSNINVRSDKNGSPQTVKANYSFSNFGKIYSGNVSLTFAKNIPKCLYFSDAPQTCRHPSRRVINKYEKGKYLN